MQSVAYPLLAYACVYAHVCVRAYIHTFVHFLICRTQKTAATVWMKPLLIVSLRVIQKVWYVLVVTKSVCCHSSTFVYLHDVCTRMRTFIHTHIVQVSMYIIFT